MNKTEQTKEHKKNKYILLFVVVGFFLLNAYGVWKANRSDERIDNAFTDEGNRINKAVDSKLTKEVTAKKIDSIIKDRVDYRFTSYDNRFLIQNGVVVNSNDSIIGKLYIFTNDNEIEDYYSDKDFRKTKFYHNLKGGILKVKEK